MPFTFFTPSIRQRHYPSPNFLKKKRKKTTSVFDLLLGKNVPRHLSDRRILRSRSGKVHKDQLFPLSAWFITVHDIANFRMHIFLSHEPGLDGTAQLPHLLALPDQVAHHLAGLLHFRRNFVLGGLVRPARDDGCVWSQPLQLEDSLASRGLGEDHVRVAYRFLRGGTNIHLCTDSADGGWFSYILDAR